MRDMNLEIGNKGTGRLGVVATGLALTAAFVPTAARAQASTGYVPLTEADEIALARSAAPATVSADATVWALRNGQYEVAVHGTNGNHCFVGRSTPRSLEPICYDEEGAATVLRWEFEYFRQRTGGASDGEREAALARSIGSGEIPLPRRPAMSYMMSSGQHLFDPESGRDAGNWRPHLMLYLPYLTPRDIGLDEMTQTLQVARPGTPMAHLVVVVPDFVDPAGTRPESKPGAPMTLKRLSPILPVETIESVLPFWTALGFEETGRVPEEGPAIFAMLEKDGVEVMFQTFGAFEEDLDRLGDIPRGGSLLYLEVDDLDAVEAVLDNADVLIPRRRMFYGADELVVREPGGHVVTFAEFD